MDRARQKRLEVIEDALDLQVQVSAVMVFELCTCSCPYRVCHLLATSSVAGAAVAAAAAARGGAGPARGHPHRGQPDQVQHAGPEGRREGRPGQPRRGHGRGPGGVQPAGGRQADRQRCDEGPQQRETGAAAQGAGVHRGRQRREDRHAGRAELHRPEGAHPDPGLQRRCAGGRARGRSRVGPGRERNGGDHREAHRAGPVNNVVDVPLSSGRRPASDRPEALDIGRTLSSRISCMSDVFFLLPFFSA